MEVGDGAVAVVATQWDKARHGNNKKKNSAYSIRCSSSAPRQVYVEK